MRVWLKDKLTVIVCIPKIIVYILFMIVGIPTKMIWYSIDNYFYLNNLKIIEVGIVFLFILYCKFTHINKIICSY